MSRSTSDDPHRPLYHFLPPSNWMNDPNGLIQWRGRYHLFYQYNPDGVGFGVMVWGHAVSDDLVHWTDLPVALAPTPGTADEHGCWSGCTVVHNGVPTIIYTGLRNGEQRPCLATSRDPDLIQWEKHPANPVIDGPPQELGVPGFRDHTAWREGDTWYQAIGAGVKGVGGAALLYRSKDLVEWEYLGPLLTGTREESGEMWECPDFFPLGGKHVLILSPVPLKKAIYFSGDLKDHRFHPQVHGAVDSGGHLYAPQSMWDDRGRRLLWGWLWEGCDQEAFEAAGWAGVMSLPRVLTLDEDSRLWQQPAPELQLLRGQEWRWSEEPLTPASPNLLKDLKGDSLEIELEAELSPGASLGLSVRCSPGREETTTIRYDVPRNNILVDRRHASLDPQAHRDEYSHPLKLLAGEHLELRVFLDRSVLEVFANGRVCLASRIYPTRADSQSLELFVHKGQVDIRSLRVWPMHSIWK